MDLPGIVAIASAGAASGGAIVWARRGSHVAAVAFLLLAALLIRGNLAGHLWLGEWDERYHGLVARNFIDHPLKPTLIDRPFEQVAPSDWSRGHVWLQKPPFAIWLMAASMALFGETEIGLRVPSVLLGTLGVWLTYLLARRFVDPPAALAAASFHAWHGRSAILSGGLRASDHVDSCFIFLVELGALLALSAADSQARGRRRATVAPLVATGVITGLAGLTMSAPALVVPGVLFLRLGSNSCSWLSRIALPLAVIAVAALLIAPWQLWTAFRFPEEFVYISGRNLRHLFTAVEGHAGAWHFHLTNVAKHFGTLSWLALAAFFVEGVRRRRDWLPLLGWFAAVYLVFSLARTKMTAYVFIASPVIWIALGWFCVDTWRRARAARPARRLAYRLSVVALVATYAVWGSLQPQDYSKAYLRNPSWSQELRYLAEKVAELGAGAWLVFNVESPIEGMFYVRATYQPELPTRARIREAEARGFRVAIYGSPSDPALSHLADLDPLAWIPFDPRTLGIRRLRAELERRGLRDPLVYNARRATDLEEYLQRGYSIDVREGLPQPSPELRADLARQRPLVILERVGESLPDGIRQRFPTAVILADPRDDWPAS